MMSGCAQAKSIAPLSVSAIPRPPLLRTHLNNTITATLSSLITMSSTAPAPTQCSVVIDDVKKRGVVIDQEFEFVVFCRDKHSKPTPVHIESQLQIVVAAYYGEFSQRGVVMPISVREDSECVGKYIVRSIVNANSSKGDDAMSDSVQATVTVAVDGTSLTKQPISITAVRSSVLKSTLVATHGIVL